MSEPVKQDSFAYLADAGWPLDQLRWYMNNNVGMDELARAVKDMLARGMTMEEIIQSAAPPYTQEEPPAANPAPDTKPRLVRAWTCSGPMRRAQSWQN